MLNAVKTRWLNTPEEFLAIKEPWNALAQFHPHSIFLSHEWFQAVFCWQPPLAQFTIWVAQQNEKICGIIPLRILKTNIRGIPIRQLEWLSVPDSQFFDVIAKPEHKLFLLQTFFDELQSNPFHWDILYLYPLYQDFIETLKQCSIEIKKTIYQSSHHYITQITNTWESFYQSRSRRLKKGNNHLRNKLQQAGDIQIDYIDANAALHFAQDGFADLISLSQSSWKHATQTTFNFCGPQNFITQLYKTALEKHWLSLWFLRFNGKAIAFELQLKTNTSVYALRSDFDNAYKHLAPGSYLNWKILETLHKNKSFAYYFMGPGSNTYKERWQNIALPIYYLRAYANSTKGKLLYNFNEKLIPQIKTHFSI